MPTPAQLPSQPLSGVVPVTVIFSSPGALGLPFNQGIIIGNSPVINSVLTRAVSYTSTTAMLQAGFTLTQPEYLAAELYFGQSPAPSVLWVGIQDLTALNTVTVAANTIKTVTDGSSGGTGYTVGDEVSVNGVTGSVLKVASVSTGAVTGWTILAGGTGASVGNNISTTAITGSGSGATVDVTAISSGGGTGYLVGDSVTVLQTGATPGYCKVATVTSGGVVATLTPVAGQQGTGFSIAEGIPTSTTGAGTGLEVNITAIGETPVQAVAACRASTPLWYIAVFVGSHADGSPVTDSDQEAIAAFIEGANPASQYFYRDYSSATLNGQASGLAGTLQASGYRRSNGRYSTIQGPASAATLTSGSPTATLTGTLSSPYPQYQTISAGQLIIGNGIPVGTTVVSVVGTTLTMSANATLTGSSTLGFGNAPNNVYAAAASMGRAMGLNTATPGSYYAMAYKNIIGVIAEPITTNQAALICGTAIRSSDGLNCNVIVNYQFGSYTSLEQFGTQASGNFFDEILQLDMLVNNIQTTIFNYFTTSGAVPITDAGVTQLKNLVQQCLATSQQIGFIAPSGIWQGVTIGTGNQQVGPGDPLPQGYYIYAPAVSSLSQQQLANRQLPPITVLLIEAGSGLAQVVVLNVQP